MPNNTIKPDLALVQRLLMRIDPLFFTYAKPEQDKRRQTYCYQHDDLVDAFLFEHVFKLPFEPGVENVEKLSSRQLDVFNAYRTALKGIGENAFVFNEFQPKDFNLRDYPTLRDYDEHEFHYQQAACKKHSDGDFIEKPFRLYLKGNWTRWLDGQGQFYYSTQYSLSHYLIQKLDQHASARVDELIPHDYIEGPNNSKRTKHGFLWDYKIDAKGLERQLDELKERSRGYLNRLQESLNDAFHEDSECAVYFDIYDSDDGEPWWDVIVKNARTAQHIRFESYLKDCEQFVKPMCEIDQLFKTHREQLDTFLEKSYQDVMENLDPNVTPLKKKMNIVFSPQAIDDLSRLSDDNDE